LDRLTVRREESRVVGAGGGEAAEVTPTTRLGNASGQPVENDCERGHEKISDAMLDVLSCIEMLYNPRRLHSHLG